MGVIRLQHMTFYGHHGVLAAERELGQIYEVDVEFSLDLRGAVMDDDLSQTVDYRKIYSLVEKVVEESEFNLLEALAQAILDALVRRFGLDQALVRVRKPHPPIQGQIDCVEVELSAD